MARDVTELLNKVIDLIEVDVDKIAKLSSKGKLNQWASADLRGYSKALLDLTSTVTAKEKEEKGKLSRMTTEELAKLAKDIIEGKK